MKITSLPEENNFDVKEGKYGFLTAKPLPSPFLTTLLVVEYVRWHWESPAVHVKRNDEKRAKYGFFRAKPVPSFIHAYSKALAPLG